MFKIGDYIYNTRCRNSHIEAIKCGDYLMYHIDSSSINKIKLERLEFYYTFDRRFCENEWKVEHNLELISILFGAEDEKK